MMRAEPSPCSLKLSHKFVKNVNEQRPVDEFVIMKARGREGKRSEKKKKITKEEEGEYVDSKNDSFFQLSFLDCMSLAIWCCLRRCLSLSPASTHT